MAGESPDRSEQKQSSGETAESERDPRLAVFRDAPTDTETSEEEPESGEASEETSTETPTETSAEPDSVAAAGEKRDSEGDRGGQEGSRGGSGGSEAPEGGSDAPEGGESGDARLKAAVAAWVAGKDAPEGAEGAESGEGATEGASGAAEAPAGDEAAEGKAGSEAESALPVRKPGGKAKKGAGRSDQATAVFGTVAPKPAPADDATRVFAAVKPKGGEGEEKAPAKAAEKDPENGAKKDAEARKATAAAIPKRSETAKKAEAAAASKDTESTGSADKKDATKDADKDVTEGAKKGDGGGAKKDAEGSKESAGSKTSEGTKESKGDEQPKGSTDAKDAKTAKDAKPAEDAKGTASAAKSSKAGKVGEDSKPGEEPKDAGKPGKPGKEDAEKSGSGKEKDAAEKSGKASAERDAERTSQFVALKSADERPVKPPKPVGKAVAKPTAKPGAASDIAKAPGGTAASAPLPPAAEATAPARPGPQPAAQPSSAAPEGAPLPESERTKQQPLPPLDLLAQLTNTPPPPETPIRTIVRRFKIWTPLALLLLLIFVIVQAVRPLPDPALALTSDATYSFDGGKPSLPWPTEGQAYVEVSGLGPIGSYGAQKPIPIGSVAKTMTAYIIMRDHPLKPGKKGDMIRVDKQAEEDGKKGAGHGDESVLDTVKEGDYISQKDALSAVMIPSANNIARLLARWDAGSQEAFVKKMNATAKDLGMKNTTYTDPSGLIETTVSTAQDQVKLGKKAMEIRSLVDITKLPTWTDPSGKTWRNFNTLPPYNNAIGLKTGSTSKAGGNLLFAGRQQVGDTTQLIVGAVLGQHRPPIIDTANAISKDLLTTTQGALEDRTVVKKGDVVGLVDDGLGGTTPVVATEDLKAVGWNGLTVKLGLTDKGKAIPHTAKAGTEVGVLTAGSGPGQASVPVALQKDLAEPTFGAKLTRVG